MALDEYGSGESLNRIRYNREQSDFTNTMSGGERISKLEVLARLEYLNLLATDAVESDATGYGIPEEDLRRAKFNNLNDVLANNDAHNIEPPFNADEVTAFKATITALAWYLEGKRIPGQIFPEDR